MVEVQAGLGFEVKIYQMSGDSPALELTAKGTQYHKDSDLS